MQPRPPFALAITTEHLALLVRDDAGEWDILEQEERQNHSDHQIDDYLEKLHRFSEGHAIGLFLSPELYSQEESAEDDFYAGMLADEREFTILRRDYDALCEYLLGHNLRVANFGLIEKGKFLPLRGADGLGIDEKTHSPPRKRALFFLILGFIAIILLIWLPFYHSQNAQTGRNPTGEPPQTAPITPPSNDKSHSESEPHSPLKTQAEPDSSTHLMNEESASSPQELGIDAEPAKGIEQSLQGQSHTMAENFYPPRQPRPDYLMALSNHPLSGAVIIQGTKLVKTGEDDGNAVQIIEGKPNFLIIARPSDHAEPIAPPISSPPRRDLANLLEPKPSPPPQAETPETAEPSASETDIDAANDQGNAERRGPSSGAIADLATQRDIFSFSDISIIGIFGKTNNLSAVLRRNNGKVVKLSSGDKVDGWTVAAITPTQVVLTRGIEQKTLDIPR